MNDRAGPDGGRGGDVECFDCAGVDRPEPAVAVCVDCGAGVCREHARLQVRRLMRAVPMSRPEPAGPPARTILCPVCHTAREAVPDAARGDLAIRRT